MGTGVDLLRLLEPTVRPGNVAGSARTTGEPPIEAKSFDELLAEAKGSSGETGEGDGGVAISGAKPADPLRELAQVSRIENAAVLRKWEQSA